MPPVVTQWMRLEPLGRRETIDDGLRAAVHDPLWLLTRQWQLGELQGEDAASPVFARLRAEATRLTRYQPRGVGPTAGVTGQLLLDGATPPLETLVERERVRVPGAWRPRLAAEAGLHFLRLLDTPAPLPGLRAGVLSRFRLQVPPEDPLRPPDGDTRRFLLVTAGRVPDGALLYAVLEAVRSGSVPPGLPAPFSAQVTAGVQAWQTWLPALPVADRDRLTRTATDFATWYRALISEPAGAPPGAPAWVADAPAWLGERMEYDLAVAAPMPPSAAAPQDEVVLAATEYTDGALDWYSFDVLRGASLGAVRADLSQAERERESIVRETIPTPLRYPGMPAPRWWEFEDARVDFGAVQAGPIDLARLLLVEFALVTGDDWYLIPVDLPVGTLCRTRSLVVTDTFGERNLILPSEEVDRRRFGEAEPPWRLFRLAADRRPVAQGTRPLPALFFLPPTLAGSLHGAPLEDVLLLRDEVANLAWAVERVVESPIGRPLDRAAAYARARREASPPPSGAPDGPAPAYRLATEVPEHWVPMSPVRVTAGDPPIQFRRRGLPLGRILEPERERAAPPVPLLVAEEEVTRAGARVTRAYQYTRWTDGATYLWVGRRKGVGRGEGASGLRFDVLVPVPDTP